MRCPGPFFKFHEAFVIVGDLPGPITQYGNKKGFMFEWHHNTSGFRTAHKFVELFLVVLNITFYMSHELKKGHF